MDDITRSHTIAATPEQVWAVLTDVARAAQTLQGVTRVHLMTDGPYAVGTRWRETRTMLGKSSTQEMWVAENDPWRRTVIRSEAGGASYTTEFLLRTLGAAEAPAGTELTMRFSGTAQDPSALEKAAMKVFGGMAAKATAKALEQDLADIAAAAEAAAAAAASA